MNCQIYPTINEIVMLRADRKERQQRQIFSNLYTPFKVGDTVEFIFSGMRKTGRVTTIIRRSGINLYNIETNSHQWFQKIDESEILSKLN